MSFPTRAETTAVLTSLANGTLTPTEANNWACPFVTDDASHPAIRDVAVWRALNHLFGADLENAPGELLHGPADFAAWVNQFTSDV